jgi:hypothetical protein
MQIEIHDNAFAQELFESVSALWPHTSVRSFSRALSMSTGYWSSIKAQNLPISSKALTNLSTLLEQRMITEKYDATKLKMRAIQSKINCELARRFLAQVEADEGVLEELGKLIDTDARSGCTSSLPMPFIFTSY